MSKRGGATKEYGMPGTSLRHTQEAKGIPRIMKKGISLDTVASRREINKPRWRQDRRPLGRRKVAQHLSCCVQGINSPSGQVLVAGAIFLLESRLPDTCLPDSALHLALPFRQGHSGGTATNNGTPRPVPMWTVRVAREWCHRRLC